MRIRLCAALAALIAGTAATTAVADTARLAALGGNADYVQDERAVLRWYASGVDHDGVAVFDLGRFDTGGGGKPWSDRISAQSGGVHARLGHDGQWGTAAAYFHTDGVQAAPTQIHADYPGGAFSLVWARAWGGWTVGAGFRGSTNSDFGYDEATVIMGRTDYRHDWGLGLRRRLSSRALVEVAGEVRDVQFAYDDQARNISVADAGHRSYGVRARATLALSPQVTMIPLCDYARDIQTIYSEPLGDVAGEDAWQLRLGLGWNVERPNGDRLVFSAEYRDARENQDGLGSLYRDFDLQQRKWWSINVRAAAESDLRPWLTARVSLQYRRVDDEAKLAWLDPQLPVRYGYDVHIGVDTPLGVGVTARTGRFLLDAAYNDRAPLSLTTAPDANTPRQAANYATLSVRYLY